MRNKSVNQVCHRKVLKKIRRNLGNQLFIAVMIGISAETITLSSLYTVLA